MNNIEDIFNNYFAKNDKSDINVNISKDVKSDMNTDKFKEHYGRQQAEGLIQDIDELGEIIRVLLNAIWGDSWGEFKPELSKNEIEEGVSGDVITYDINSREVAIDDTPKPRKSRETFMERNEKGEFTGVKYEVSRQRFECILEFNFWGQNSLNTRKLMNNFERIIGLYTGYLKRLGVSELVFLKEFPSKKSVNYVKGIPMRATAYYLRLERVHLTNVSTINNIDIIVEAYINSRNKK